MDWDFAALTSARGRAAAKYLAVARQPLRPQRGARHRHRGAGAVLAAELIAGTSAATLVRGILILLTLGFVLSNVFNLTMLQFLLRNSIPALIFAIPVLFQPEIRRALEQLGRAGSLIPRTYGRLAQYAPGRDDRPRGTAAGRAPLRRAAGHRAIDAPGRVRVARHRTWMRCCHRSCC